MINKTLTKQLAYYNGKCGGLHNMMKYASPSEMSKLYPKYEQYSKKRSEIERKITSDGKHEVMIRTGGFYCITDTEGNIIWDEVKN